MKSEEQRKCLTSELTWTATGTPGVEKKLIVAGNETRMHEVSILRLASGARLPSLPEGWGIEVVVLEGSWQLPEGNLKENGYARRPPGKASAGLTVSGCTLYVRSGPFAENDEELVHSQTEVEPWLAGHGNLRVKALHSIDREGSAFVHWPAGERFIRHQHWGGEEIFVLSGTFRDEHGSYPRGTWIQSPHLSTHRPFVEEETVIFVKTGHLPIPLNESVS
jgi:anti-sigma factor ChrR (cupin superfamily)